MPTATRMQSGDPRLQPFLEAGTEAEAASALEGLFGGEVETTLREAVARGLREVGGAAGQHEDIAADVRVKLVRKLWSLRRGEGEPVENFLGYVTSAAENGCYEFLRQRYPERTRFRNRVRYAVAHHRATCLTQDAQGVWLCASRAPGPQRMDRQIVEQFLDDPRAWLHRRRIDVSQPLPALVHALLDSARHPVPLDRLVEALAMVLGVAEVQPSAPRAWPGGAQGGAQIELVADPRPAAGEVLEQRQALALAWEEIVQLPPRQRVALLLNLRDGEGASMLQMLPATGVVTAAAIAAALDLRPAELDALWASLPLDDLTIAERLGITRQQVINLRKAARARLSRRLGGQASGAGRW